MNTTASCFVCNGDSKPWHFVNDWNIVRCRKCGTGWLDPMPTESELQKLYEEYYEKYPARSIESDLFKKLQSHYSHINNKRLDTLESVFEGTLSGKSVLDIGCANGLFMKDAMARGMTAHGTEVSHMEAQEARDLVPGVNVFEGVLEKIDLPSNTYDVVTGWDVLEHITDQNTFLDEVYRILKPGGVFAASTINVDGLNRYLFQSKWGFFIPPEHVVFYSAPALRAWFDIKGWNMHRLRTYYAPQLTVQGLLLSLQGEKKVEGFNTPTNMGLLKAKKVVADTINAPLQYSRFGDILELYARTPR